MHPDDRTKLLDESAPDWFHLEQEQNASCIKSGHARKTWRVSFENQTYIVKVFERGKFFDRIKHFFVRHQAWREWKQAHKAHVLGISVTQCLAMGRGHDDPYRTVLILQHISQAQTLSTAWKQAAVQPGDHKRHQATKTLISTIARLFACAHERGFIHRDAHPNNILIRETMPGKHEAVWIDVYDSRIYKRPASYRDRVRCLAQLDHYFKHHATRTERLRFLRSYIKQYKLPNQRLDQAQLERSLISDVAHAEALHGVQLALHRDRRMRRNSRYFMRVQPGRGWSGKVALILERRHAFPETGVQDRTLKDWNDLFQSFMGENSIFDQVQNSITLYNVKIDIRYAKNLWTKICWTIRGTPHRKYFYHCHYLRHRDLPAPIVLGYAQHRSGMLVDAAILISEPRP